MDQDELARYDEQRLHAWTQGFCNTFGSQYDPECFYEADRWRSEFASGVSAARSVECYSKNAQLELQCARLRLEVSRLNGEILSLRERLNPKKKPYYYQDEMFCRHCDKDTQHKIHDTDHERDSSGDWRECLVCHWTKSGHGEYEPPSAG